MQKYRVSRKFENFYSGKMEKIDLCYSVYPGFKDIDSAKRAVSDIGQDPECFVYITFKNELYGVSVEKYVRQMVVGADVICYGYKQWSHSKYEGKDTWLELSKASGLDTIIVKPESVPAFNTNLVNDLREINGDVLDIERGKKVPQRSYAFRYMCLAVLAMTFFDTCVPVFKLNALDYYMNDQPSRWRLWEKGIEAYNPYTGVEIYAHIDGKPYTYAMYVSDTELSGE